MPYAFNDDKSKAKIALIQDTITIPTSGTGSYLISVPTSLGLDLTKCHILSFGVNPISGATIVDNRHYNSHGLSEAYYSIAPNLNSIQLNVPVNYNGGSMFLVNFVIMEID